MFSIVLSIFWSKWTVFAGALIFAVYKWSTAKYDFFAKKNVEYEKPYPLIGNYGSVMLQQESFFEMFRRLYLKHRNRKYFGVFELRNPILIVNSPDLIKQITVKDFDSFLNRRVILDAEIEPLFGNSLFALTDQKWKDMRATLSPAFTGSKMRIMFQLVEECSQNANKYLRAQLNDHGVAEVDLKDLFTRFTNDVIASCAFGLRIDSLLKTDSQFYHMSRKATNFTGLEAIKFLLYSSFRSTMKFFKVQLFDSKFSEYFSGLVLNTMKKRAEEGIVRPDMINLLMEARKGTLEANDLGKTHADDGFAIAQESLVGQNKVVRNWTDDDMVAQCFLFFAAGFETSSVLMCFCAHELMENPDVQKKLIAEVDQVRKELGDEPLTYEVIQGMKYLDMVMSETLRKWPPALGMDRVCNKPYLISDNEAGDIQLLPGDVVAFSAVGIHYDPEYYPNPNKFIPERFSDENKHKIQPFTYMPFGVGPRNCIGSRFALMESKAIMFHLLSEFTIEAGPKTSIPMKLGCTSFQLKPKSGFWLNFRPRNKKAF